MMWWWFCAVIAPSLAPSGSQHGSHPVAAPDSGDGIMMVRWWDGEIWRTTHNTDWAAWPAAYCRTAAATHFFIHSCLHYLSPLSVWDGHRRTSHSFSLISNIYCQNWTNTFAHLSYTVSLGLPMGGLDKDACDAGWIWNEKCCSCREMVSAGTYCELATKCDVIIFKLHKYYTLCGVQGC